MKITGIVLVLLGLVAGAVCVFQLTNGAPPSPDAPAVGPSPGRPNMTIPLAVCGAAIVIGGLLIMFGGRSYFEHNNPNVRN
ncbi:MAG TPA: hypothetical protein VKD90_01385 [Gemmataceae bacterium]|nr:hypothetical protein [Gemmataceae bacterium]